MEQISPIQALLQQRTLLQLEYYTEKEAFRKLTEQMGMQRKVKRGDAWFPLQVGKSFYNSLNQTAIEVFRTSDQDIEHNFEFGRPVMFFMVKKMGKNESQGNAALQQPENASDANHKVQNSNLKVQSIKYFSFTGTVSYVDDTFYDIPAYPAHEVVDATGGGDTYSAGYLYKRLQGANPVEAGKFAAAMCTIKLEHNGPFNRTIQDVERVMK